MKRGEFRDFFQSWAIRSLIKFSWTKKLEKYQETKEMIIEQQRQKIDPFLDQIELVDKFADDYEFNLVLPGDVISDNEGLIQ